MSKALTGEGAVRRADPRPAARGRRVRATWWPFALPALVVVLGLYFVPLILNGFLAFTNWSSFHSGVDFTGSRNLEILLDQSTLLNQIWLTLIYALTAALVSNTMSLGLALALERRTPVNELFRAVFFIPVLLSPLAAGYIWSGIFAPNGVLNQGLGLIGLPDTTAWLADRHLAIFLVGIVDGWKWSGFFTLIMIAALATVPADLKDAAMTDGANGRQIFRNVKLPFLAPAFTYNITVTVVGALSAFDIIVAMTGGGPGSATRVLNALTLQQFGQGYFGLSSMTSLVVTVLVIILAIPLVSWLRRREMQS
jgi:raffinose/stachyose/melibiose transport system permease protein